MAKPWILNLVLILSVTGLAVAAEADTQQRMLRPAVIKIERGGKTSYLIGTYDLRFREGMLDPFIRTIIESKPQFLTELLPSDAAKYQLQLSQQLKRQAEQRRQSGVSLAKQLGLLSKEWWSLVFIFHDRTLGSLAYAPPRQMEEELRKRILKEAQYEGLDASAPNLSEQLATIAFESRKKLASFYQLLDPAQFYIWSDRSYNLEILKRLVQNYLLVSAQSEVRIQKQAETLLSGDIEDFIGLQNAHAGVMDENIKMRTVEELRRHRRWVPVIEKMHDQGGVVVAVGAEHLFGNYYENLIDLLRQSGFEITPVRRHPIRPSMCAKLF